MKRFVPQSLSARLIAAGVMAACVGGLLGWLFLERTIQRSAADLVDARLSEVLSELRGVWATYQITGSIPAVTGDLELLWQIEAEGSVVMRSELLVQNATRLPKIGDDHQTMFEDVPSELGEIRLASRVLREMAPAPPQSGERQYRQVAYWVAYTEDRRDYLIDTITTPLRQSAVFTLAAFIALLLASLSLLLWLMRAPLSALEREAEAFAEGEIETLTGSYPRELQLVVDHLNRASARHASLTERTRRYINKIAHDLKTPISVVRQALLDPNQHKLAERRLVSMQESLDRYSALATAIGPNSPQPARPLLPMLEEAVSAFALLYRKTPLAFEIAADTNLEARISKEDVEAIVSNLLSNAHKHAHSRVRLSGEFDNELLCIACEDDGPGLSEDAFDAALGWGVRLDERPAGSGFGLTILRDFAELYQGCVVRFDTELGGLGVAVRLKGCTP